VNPFVPEFLCQKARDKYEQFGRMSRGVSLRETPDSILQWSTTTPGAEKYVARRKAAA
jgi:hypothetical protein